ncbi:MAG: flagellar biosynthesis regulator FlaF [Pseudomonadota bacterium]
MSLQAYQATQKTVESPREAEYRIFGQVTSALVRAEENTDDLKARIDAVGDNRKLWSALAMDCATEGNGLPDVLRAQIISLSIWVGKYSTEVMTAKASMEPLIDVNRAVMEGLK